jgi:hypothetical protein
MVFRDGLRLWRRHNCPAYKRQIVVQSQGFVARGSTSTAPATNCTSLYLSAIAVRLAMAPGGISSSLSRKKTYSPRRMQAGIACGGRPRLHSWRRKRGAGRAPAAPPACLRRCRVCPRAHRAHTSAAISMLLSCRNRLPNDFKIHVSLFQYGIQQRQYSAPYCKRVLLQYFHFTRTLTYGQCFFF